MATFVSSFTRSFGFFAYAACWITLYRLYAFLHPSHHAVAASNQALWRIVLVCLLFVIQHSAMATPQWKSFWSSSSFASAQRSAYSLSSAVLLEILMHFWLGSPTIVWNLESPLVASFCKYAYPISWALIVYQLLALDHFELFGLAQTVGRVKIPVVGVTKAFERAQLPHPIFLPIVVLLTAVPLMTFDRLLLALGSAAYLLSRNNVTPADWSRPL